MYRNVLVATIQSDQSPGSPFPGSSVSGVSSVSGLANKTPASVYEPSPRPFPSKLLTPDYPAHFEVRKVSSNGGIRWHSAWVNVSHLLGGEYIGLEEVASDVWAVSFGPVSLGWLHTPKLVILDHDGSSSRNPIR